MEIAQEVIDTAAKANFFDRLVKKYGVDGVMRLLEASGHETQQPVDLSNYSELVEALRKCEVRLADMTEKRDSLLKRESSERDARYRAALQSLIHKSFLTNLDPLHLSHQILEMVSEAKAVLKDDEAEGISHEK